jgi:hypothetical protein
VTSKRSRPGKRKRENLKKASKAEGEDGEDEEGEEAAMNMMMSSVPVARAAASSKVSTTNSSVRPRVEMSPDEEEEELENR